LDQAIDVEERLRAIYRAVGLEPDQAPQDDVEHKG
jgi:hypothetical protein